MLTEDEKKAAKGVLIMRDTLIPPFLAKQLVADDDAMCGTGKIVTCNHSDRAIFGGVVREHLGDPNNQNWLLTVGTIIIVPSRQFVWAGSDGVCGWTIEDILTGGLDHERFWRPVG